MGYLHILMRVLHRLLTPLRADAHGLISKANLTLSEQRW